MATLAERLVEAEAAYHDWSIGKHARAYTDQNGERVEFSTDGLRRLPAYIKQLKIDIAAEASGSTVDEGPIRLVIL